MLKELKQCIQNINPFTKSAIMVGYITMLGYYIASMISTCLVPYSAAPRQMYHLAKEYLQTAPACFVAACVIALLLDVVYHYDIAPKK